MKTTISEDDRTVIKSDEYLSESGLQGGKIIGEHLALGCVIIGIPFLLIGLYAFFCMFFDLGFPMNTAILIGSFLITIIGLLLLIGGYFIYI
ncbi:MAG: hypothetical protein JW840_00170 [Candidatus Thermoplasmatota archaeon]|nr:hypothetical protein [Candidatus Thermoplasmatota archaeon]